MTTFYLGTHQVGWLAHAGVPLFVSARRLRVRKALPRANSPWALDSGGFTELGLHGGWRTPALRYAAEVETWSDRIGPPDFAAPQDWMCEPGMLARTGLSVAAHQELTTLSYLHLRGLAPAVAWLPVLQGWLPDDYVRHAELYRSSGADLRDAPLVGVGTLCRRGRADQVAGVLRALWRAGLTHLHAFGLRSHGLRRFWDLVDTADSLAWSQHARRDAARARRGLPRRWACPAGRHLANRSGCVNCLAYALGWRDRLLSPLS